MLLRAFVAALMSSPGLAWAGEFGDGLAAYAKQKFPLAVQKFKRAAAQGSPGAQFYLGVMHGLGQGVAPDPAAELDWYRLAAERGLAVAQFNTGIAGARGQGWRKIKPRRCAGSRWPRCRATGRRSSTSA